MSIKAGNAIFGLLSSDTQLSALIGNRIYPIKAMDETTYPYIAYRRKNLVPAYTKQTSSVEDSVFIDVYIVTETYDEGTDIVEHVMRVLDRKKGQIAGLDISGIRLSDSAEDADEVYMQALEFEVKINILK